MKPIRAINFVVASSALIVSGIMAPAYAAGPLVLIGQEVAKAVATQVGSDLVINAAKTAMKNAAKNPKNVASTASDVKDVALVGTTAATVVASGSTIMGTMATAGAAVGGGVVAGTALVGGAGGLGAASMLNKHVFNGNTQGDEAARIATYGGAAAGTVGGIAAISTAGTVAGLSGAGITSGLAAIGATVGGGMAAGTVLVVAAPVAAAAAVGYGAYYLFSEPNPNERTWGEWLAGN